MRQADTRLRLHERPRTPMTGEGQRKGAKKEKRNVDRSTNNSAGQPQP
jgi:hypothetical protein